MLYKTAIGSRHAPPKTTKLLAAGSNPSGGPQDLSPGQPFRQRAFLMEGRASAYVARRRIAEAIRSGPSRREGAAAGYPMRRRGAPVWRPPGCRLRDRPPHNRGSAHGGVLQLRPPARGRYESSAVLAVWGYTPSIPPSSIPLHLSRAGAGGIGQTAYFRALPSRPDSRCLLLVFAFTPTDVSIEWWGVGGRVGPLTFDGPIWVMGKGP